MKSKTSRKKKYQGLARRMVIPSQPTVKQPKAGLVHERRSLGRPTQTWEIVARDFWFSYFGANTLGNKVAAAKRLRKWSHLTMVVIPDSGADMCTLGGGAWVIGKASGPECQSRL